MSGACRALATSVTAASRRAGSSVSVAFTGTTRPSAVVDVPLGTGAPTVSTVASGILREGNSVATTGVYFMLSVWGDQMSTAFYSSSVTNGGLSATDRGMGPGMSNASGSIAVFVVMCGNTTTARIYTWVGSVMTQQAAQASLFSGAGTDVIALIPSLDAGGIYTYTVFKNGVATALKWVDSTAVIGTPGKYPCGAFRHGYSGGQFSSPGIKAYAAADL